MSFSDGLIGSLRASHGRPSPTISRMPTARPTGRCRSLIQTVWGLVSPDDFRCPACGGIGRHRILCSDV